MITTYDRYLLSLLATAIITCTTPALAADKHAEAGAAIYDDYCSRCHGESLRNTSGGVTFDLRRLRENERERFVNSVLNGKKDMPPGAACSHANRSKRSGRISGRPSTDRIHEGSTLPCAVRPPSRLVFPLFCVLKSITL